jgi:hypothetical protein
MRKTLRRTILALCQVVLIATVTAQPVLPADTASTSAKTDPEIQQCISERFAASPSLKDQGLTAAVANGVATLSGTARNPGSKGAATNIAKKCGATSVTNKIEISPSYKPVKKSGGEKNN